MDCKTYKLLLEFAPAGRLGLAGGLNSQLVGGLQARFQPRGGGKSFPETILSVPGVELPSRTQCFLKCWGVS